MGPEILVFLMLNFSDKMHILAYSIFCFYLHKFVCSVDCHIRRCSRGHHTVMWSRTSIFHGHQSRASVIGHRTVIGH